MTPENLEDPLWRLNNLYKVKRASDGALLPFRPRKEQQHIFEEIYTRGRRRLLILKARRLGLSTGLDILAADQALWNEGRQISIIDQTREDAERKLDLICKPAIEAVMKTMPGWGARFNASAMHLQAKGCQESIIFGGVRSRGGTNHFLHISEWGCIQADDVRRSEEILTGALPSAEHGTIVVETTWKGGRGGHVYNLVKEAQSIPDEEKTEADWRLIFFPWWVDPTYTLPANLSTVEPEVMHYLEEKERELGIRFTDGQKTWYAAQKRSLGIFIYREFPTTLDECFRAPLEGAIYADLIEKARSERRIVKFNPDRRALVHTCWDLGSPINTVTWYFQIVGSEIRIIDLDVDKDLTITDRVAQIVGRGYPLGTHILPHDAAATQTSGRTVQQELEAAGLKNTVTVPRTTDVWVGINQLRDLFPRLVFQAENCDRGIECLENYHSKRESIGGVASDKPVHDWSSHASDALRMMAEAMQAGIISSALTGAGSTPRPEVKVSSGYRG